jgi:hypothetical protein
VPDYSHFQSRSGDENRSHFGVVAVRMESHQHGSDGGWHLSIDVRLGPRHKIMLEAIKSGFNALMQSLSPLNPIKEENYFGADADREDLKSLEEYYQEVRREWSDPDPWRSN